MPHSSQSLTDFSSIGVIWVRYLQLLPLVVSSVSGSSSQFYKQKMLFLNFYQKKFLYSSVFHPLFTILIAPNKCSEKVCSCFLHVACLSGDRTCAQEKGQISFALTYFLFGLLKCDLILWGSLWRTSQIRPQQNFHSLVIWEGALIPMSYLSLIANTWQPTPSPSLIFISLRAEVSLTRLCHLQRTSTLVRLLGWFCHFYCLQFHLMYFDHFHSHPSP